MNPNNGRRFVWAVMAIGILALLTFTVSKGTMMPVQARPLQAVPAYVYVCDNAQPNHTCDNPNDLPLGPYAFESDYVATVLRNEWGVNGYMQALYAGDSPAL